MSTRRRLLPLRRPSPRQLLHGFSMIFPSPEHLAQGAETAIWPRSVWRTVRTSPRPPQPSQLFVPEPFAAPLPPHGSQATRMSRLTSRVPPRIDSAKLTFMSKRRSSPGGGPVRRAPRAAPPKKPSKRSSTEPKSPPPNPPENPPPGKPPAPPGPPRPPPPGAPPTPDSPKRS